MYILCVLGVRRWEQIDARSADEAGFKSLYGMEGPHSARETPFSSVSDEINFPAALERVRMLLNGKLLT